MDRYESNTTTTTYTSTYSSDGQSYTNVSSESTHSSTTLYINVVSASNLIASQRFGKQDPYLQFTLDVNKKDSFTRTFTHKDGGDKASWNQSFTINLNGESDLFIEVLNEETTTDEAIGFAAIPINQVVHSHGAFMNGLFDVYDIKGQRAGVLNLQLAAQGFPNSQKPDFTSEPVRGQSYVNETHKERMNASKTKKTGIAVGSAILGGALAVGAGFLGKKVYDDHKEKEEEEHRQEEEKARLQKESEEKQSAFDSERQRFEAEKAEFENQRRTEQENQKHAEEERQKRSEEESHKRAEEESHKAKKECEPKKKECEPKKKDCKPKKKNCDDSGSDSDSSDSGSDSDDDKKKKKKDCKPKKKSCDSDDEKKKKKKDCHSDGKNWDPVGTYSAGDRVKYHGKTYVCLQGHTSNPTWTPDAAHSLWQTA
ncbi:hypothetical protein BY458DRAFT_514945 [Sporodiniella umbellata]|nr:hypothetical protein BY458DRAFT_514945 [Sporodiniella umbellata]